MGQQITFQYVQGSSFSELFAADIADSRKAFLLSYPSTASWSPYPNTSKYLIQDGNVEEKKAGFDQIRQREPWKIMAVLGNRLPGLMTSRPPDGLIDYWKDAFGYSYDNMQVLPHERWADILNQEQPYTRIITLFPYDHILPGLHAVDPDAHYYLLSKCSLADICPSVPPYQVYDLYEIDLDQLPLPSVYPYAVKTSHGLSGEGTYIIHNDRDKAHCLAELQIYVQMRLVRYIVVMAFVSDVTDNYCVQFYVDRTGGVSLIGATHQLVSETGVHLGGIIRFQATDMNPFFDIIQHVALHVHQRGYFGVIGVDILKDKDGRLHVIDANIRVNGSTPLCLQRNQLLDADRETAKYSTDYCFQGSLDQALKTFKKPLDGKDFMILSALETRTGSRLRTDIYGIVTGKDPQAMLQTEKRLADQGLLLLN
jgi:hypothetical protein